MTRREPADLPTYRITLCLQEWVWLSRIAKAIEREAPSRPELQCGRAIINVHVPFEDPPKRTIVSGTDGEGVRTLMNLVYQVTGQGLEGRISTETPPGS